MVVGFVDFVREQGVIGLAVGFILGGSISKVVTSLVTDIINPILGIVLGAAGDLKDYSLKIGSVNIKWGDFLANVIDFLVIATVIYFGVKLLRLDRLDKPKKK
ncbi:hypothetical protein A3D77_04910 [Candidatus Gottesmanbacteria bacterium RIFCSPHIGHO2_02_FULL_39_11]|uniref:Mechanosensitive ion channel protein MscL n=1 Tax=Candidatus Gottesmanbacteria bacterium RIFCSPHIGHO2_02_FULL_39_11 TaxID=1798382 RepID=A0A1F5ZLS4_9BACT|nr:MAG: hypothetical protein A3D77_04910 [Candidatus Gottesmanbacteria bacterium RIFCSPHIGHO2_02_FULL_39_11]